MYKCKETANSNSKDSICLIFSTSIADVFIVDNENKFRRLNTSVKLFLYFDIKEITKTSVNCQSIKVTNTKINKNEIFQIVNGWNLLNLDSLVITSGHVKFLNESLFNRLVISSGKECSIEINQQNSVMTSANNISKLYMSSFHNKRPLLEIVYNDNLNLDSVKNFFPIKQRRGESNLEILKNSCKVPLNPNNECCLMQYYVEFRLLFKKSIILKPLGFQANYCFGKCHKRKMICFK